jgi:hypothetical protein
VIFAKLLAALGTYRKNFEQSAKEGTRAEQSCDGFVVSAR